MNERTRESLSALMDGEADDLELRRLLVAEPSEQADKINGTWTRYHLVRDVLQSNDQGLAFKGLDISSQVSAAINHKSVPISRASGLPGWMRPVAGFAVAASVAVAVVVGVQGFTPINSDLKTADNDQPILASRVYPVQGASMQASDGAGGAVNFQNSALPGGIAASRAAADQEAQKRLEKYILRHTESAALNNGQGMISFARVASFDIEE